jgi:hypothetical protein
MFGKTLKKKVVELEQELTSQKEINVDLQYRLDVMTLERDDLLKNKFNVPDLSYIESYMFKLVRFASTDEFIQTKTESQKKLMEELSHVQQTFNVIKSLYPNTPGIVAYRKKNTLDVLLSEKKKLNAIVEKSKEQHKRYKDLIEEISLVKDDNLFVYCFVTIDAASSVLGIDKTNIVKALSGVLCDTNNYVIEYESTWQKSQPLDSSKVIKTVGKWNIDE